jgi:hypothetical protein
LNSEVLYAEQLHLKIPENLTRLLTGMITVLPDRLQVFREGIGEVTGFSGGNPARPFPDSGLFFAKGAEKCYTLRRNRPPEGNVGHNPV